MAARHRIHRHILASALCIMTLLGIAATMAWASTFHTVRQGDTLYLISMQYGVTVDQIQQANNLSGTMIYSGQVLIIPSTTGVGTGTGLAHYTYTVRQGDNVVRVARMFGISPGELRAANGITGNSLRTGQVLVIPGRAPESSGPGSGPIPVPPSPTPDPVDPSPPAPEPPLPAPSPNPGYSQSDLDLLSRLVTAEAGGEPYEGQVAVAASVLNRVKSPDFPNTISDVIFQVVDGRYYQYCVVQNGTIYGPSTLSARRAVQDAMSGIDPSMGAIGFYNPQFTTNLWVLRRPITVVIANHVFYR